MITVFKPEKIRKTLEEARCRILSWTYNISGHKRIYHIHIRKTGGTSLNYMFHSLAGSPPWASPYARLVRVPHHRVIRNGLVYVAWNPTLIDRGHYFYAFSHTPVHQLQLPPRTFTITCFRDPARRLVSHYNMLMDFKLHKVPAPCMAVEGPWLGDSFRDFLHRVPREHLQNQLYMFSAGFDISEALARVREVSHVMFTESFAAGIQELNRKTGLQFVSVHARKTQYKSEIAEADRLLLRAKLAEEYEFLDKVKRAREL